MNIGVFTDYRFVTCLTPTGVGKHIVAMVRGLSERENIRPVSLASRDQASGRGALGFMPVRKLPLSWKIAEAGWTLTGLPTADRWCKGLDWVYCPKNDLIPLRKTRVAVTVHGAHELDPFVPQRRTLNAKLNRWRRLTSYKRLLTQATVVLTVSEFLKEQVVRWFGVERDKLLVIGNGIDEQFFEAATLPSGASGQRSDRPFVLCVGGLNWLDGGDRVIEAARALRKSEPDLRVLVAGAQHESGHKEVALAQENVELLGYLPAPQLARLMRDAIALYYPTRYETFGMAAAEAMAAGTPVVTCRSTAVPEIVGEAGLYGDPDSAHEMADLILGFLNNERLRSHYSEAGRERAKQFTWGACVSRLVSALSSDR